jgi:hypothetical protein
MLYPHRCDLSPKGDSMLILAYRGAKEPLAWTALCRPPIAKALVFWPQKTTKLGGGFFDGRLPVAWINLDQKVTTPEERCECGFEFGYLEDQEATYGGAAERLERDGWKEQKRPANGNGAHTTLRYAKRSPRKDFELVVDFEAPAQGEPADLSALQSDNVRYYLRPAKRKDELRLLEGATWANWNSYGELCIAAEGRLFYANPLSPETTRREILDLNGLEPRDRTRSLANGA